MKFSILAPLILAAGIWGAGFSLSSAISRFHDFDRYVEVKGLDEQIVKADQATWQIGFSSSGADLKQIYTSISSSQAMVIKFLIDQGFQADEIQKQQVSVTDNDSNAYAQRSANTPHYSATAGITLNSTKVDLVSEALQKTGQLVQSEVIITNSSVRYFFTSLNAIKVDMLNKATDNAHNAALSFAKNSQSQLGKIKMANQGQFTITSADRDDAYDMTGMMKKVRVVTTVQYFLK